MLGARIAALRREKNMSQYTLAQELGISPSAVGMYEQGRREPDVQTIVKLSQVFGVSTDYLLTGSAAACDADAIEAIFDRAMESFGGSITLRSASGDERAFDREDVALLLAALLG